MTSKDIAKKKPGLRRRKGAGKRFKASLPLTLMALPAVIYIFIFNYVPLYGLVLPFKDYKPRLGFLGSEWAGFKNFKFILNNDQLMLAVKNTIFYNVVFILLGTAVCLAVALMLYEMSKRSVKIYQYKN